MEWAGSGLSPPPPPQRAALARGGSSRELSAALPAAPPAPGPALPARGATSPRPLSAPRLLGAGGTARPRPQKVVVPPPPILEARAQPSRDGPAPGAGSGGGGSGGGCDTRDPRRWGPNRGFRQRPNPRDSIKKLARAAGGEAKPGDLYYEDRLFKNCPPGSPAALPPAEGDPPAPGSPAGAPGGGGCVGPDPTGGGERSRRGGCGDLPGGGWVGGWPPRLSQPFRGWGCQTFLGRKDLVSGLLPPLLTFLRLPSDARCSIRAPALLVCKRTEGELA